MLGPQDGKFIYCIAHSTPHGSIILKDSFKEKLLEKERALPHLEMVRTRNYKLL